MKNFNKSGDVVELVAPAGGVVSGKALIVGSLFVVPVADAAVGEKFSGVAEGVIKLPKLSTDVVSEGAKLNWNSANKELMLATADLDGVATAVEAAANGDSEVLVKLTQV